MLTYTQVLFLFVVPPAFGLAFLARPFVSKVDLVRLVCLVVVAFLYSTPWDYFKLAHGVWGYCKDCVLFTVWLIPFEEYCFFILQTIITTLWSMLVFYPKLPLLCFLHQSWLSTSRLATVLPIFFFALIGMLGWNMAIPSTPTFYMGSILWWVSPVLILQWFIAGRYILRMGLFSVLLAIMVPTVYLWVVDAVAINSGAWFIARGTKMDDWEIFTLPIEEATFFLVTNVMVVFGFLAWDRTMCMAKHSSRETSSLQLSTVQGLKTVFRALFQADEEISEKEVEDVRMSLKLITKGSKSFHLASTFFPPAFRQDIMQLYSWCRVCDDLVDDKLAQKNHLLVKQFFDNFLSATYPNDIDPRSLKEELKEIVIESNNEVLDKLLPFEKIASFRCIKRLVEKHGMKREELAELLDGFRMDMDMDRKEVKIATNDELIYYSCCVAASVGVMCCRVFGVPSYRADIYERARDMGIALQLTNISRDIVTDAKIGRVYVPLDWFESDSERQLLLDHPWKNPARLKQFAELLINLSETYYKRAEEGIALLPNEVQKPVKLGLMFYKEIGNRILKSSHYPERAVVPLADKLAIALRVYFTPTYTDIGIFISYLLFLVTLFRF